LAGPPPRTPLGELTALPQTPSWCKGALLASKGRGEEGRGRKGIGEGEGKGKEMGREGREKEGEGEGYGREGEKGRKVETPPPSIPAYAPGWADVDETLSTSLVISKSALGRSLTL